MKNNEIKSLQDREHSYPAGVLSRLVLIPKDHEVCISVPLRMVLERLNDGGDGVAVGQRPNQGLPDVYWVLRGPLPVGVLGHYRGEDLVEVEVERIADERPQDLVPPGLLEPDGDVSLVEVQVALGVCDAHQEVDAVEVSPVLAEEVVGLGGDHALVDERAESWDEPDGEFCDE